MSAFGDIPDEETDQPSSTSATSRANGPREPDKARSEPFISPFLAKVNLFVLQVLDTIDSAVAFYGISARQLTHRCVAGKQQLDRRAAQWTAQA